MPAYLQGQIERITYTNDENGYTIARVKAQGHRDLVTVVGNLMAPIPGSCDRGWKPDGAYPGGDS